MPMSSSSPTTTHTRPFMGTKLEPRQGIPAGILAGAGMLILWLGSAELWGPGWEIMLTSIGQVLLPDQASTTALILAGLILHFLIAIGLGLLYAVSLDRLDAKDTLIVSGFYGFTLWVVSILILRHWVHVEAVQVSRSWWGFVTFLVFGLLLGIYANRFGRPPSS